MRVLVADDEYYARKAILKILAELDVEVAADMETRPGGHRLSGAGPSN